MTTVRVRLTLIYSGLFLFTSVVLLIIVNTLMRQALDTRIARFPLPPERPRPAPAPRLGEPEPPPLSELVRSGCRCPPSTSGSPSPGRRTS